MLSLSSQNRHDATVVSCIVPHSPPAPEANPLEDLKSGDILFSIIQIQTNLRGVFYLNSSEILGSLK